MKSPSSLAPGLTASEQARSTSPHCLGPDAEQMHHSRRVDPSGEMQPLLTLQEVARITQLSERTLRRMIAARKLGCLRVGRQLRFDRQALSRWLRAREEG